MGKTNLHNSNTRQLGLWIGALVLGVVLGLLNVDAVNSTAGFIATVYTRIFQLLAVPTIALAVIVTLIRLGREAGTGRLFRRTLTYTLLTTFVAALVGVALFLLIAPEGIPVVETTTEGASNVATQSGTTTYTDHILSVIPNNILQPLLEGNVLSVLLLAAAIGLGLSRLPESDEKTTLVRFFTGLQSLVFLLIRAFIRTLPLGIMAFAAQLMVQMNAGVALGSLGRYTAVILLSNALQMFVVLPLFLAAHRVNPFRAFRRMSPALLTAFFTKSSAATLPLTIATAEGRMGVPPAVARFVLPICTTINMNGCAAFIAVTSLFVMQSAGQQPSLPAMLLWAFIAVFAAVGNAGVPMGCYFLTLSLTSHVAGSAAVLALILPIYTVIDMVETAENVWSDSCVAIVSSPPAP